MKILLVISSMSSGGAERVMSIMANYWVAHGKDISLITLGSTENDFYKLDPRVRRICLGLQCESLTIWEAIKNNCVRLMRLRAAIQDQNPNIVISFIDGTNVKTLLSVFGMSVDVVISERNDPRQYSIGKTWHWLRRWLYPKSRAIVVQSAEIKEWVAGFVSDMKIHIIPNPILPVSQTRDSNKLFNKEPPFIIAMGRLVAQKGFDELLEAFALCYQEHKNWSLVIIGEGPQRNYLESLACQLGIESHVYLLGRVHGPHTILQQAQLFVLSSRYEGFPNALLEAMSCGLPVISYDCPTGPSEIITHGEDGLLIPPEDVPALAAAMDCLMKDKNERKKLGDRARRITQKYSVEKIMGMWNNIIADAK